MWLRKIKWGKGIIENMRSGEKIKKKIMSKFEMNLRKVKSGMRIREGRSII